ncbi:MAG: hypothetical protein RL416_538 [Pseudomonadota bacterium]
MYKRILMSYLMLLSTYPVIACEFGKATKKLIQIQTNNLHRNTPDFKDHFLATNES